MIRTDDTIYYPYYGRLNTAKRRLYEELLQGYQAYREKIPVTAPVQFQDVSEVIDAICCDHPELFWVSQKAVVFHDKVSGIVSAVQPEYGCPIRQIPQRQRALDAAIRRYLAKVKGKQLLEQERIIHDQMADETSYVHGEQDQTAYGVLVERKAVCAGYTRAFQLLMQKIGIPCYYCHGKAKGSADSTWGPHAWNILKLGNDFYNMDLTWDDCYDRTRRGKVAYTYYNCDDRQIAANHRRSESCSFLPACNGTRYTFRGVTGTAPRLEEIYQDGVTCRQVIRSASDFTRYIFPVIRKTAGKKTEVSFPVEGEQNFDRLKTEISDILRNGLADTIYHIQYLYTDFTEGWHRIQITITYDDPLEMICKEGVTCRQVVRSRADFERYILPAIRRSAGRAATAAFPVEVKGSLDPLRQAMNDSIRSALSGRSCSWSASWKHYCGGWYWMQFRLEYQK